MADVRVLRVGGSVGNADDGLNYEVATGTATVGSAVTFDVAFGATPRIFITGSSDRACYAASAATTGFTPTAISNTGEGGGTTCDWIAIGTKA